MSFVKTDDPVYNATMAKLDQMQTQINPAYNEVEGNLKLITDYQNGTLAKDAPGGNPQVGGAGVTTPSSAPTAEEMVTIQNDQTGQQMQVPKSQLANYAMSDGSNGRAPGTPAPAQPTFQNGQPAISSNTQPITTNQQTANGAPGFVNPQGGQELADQQQAQQMWRGSKNLQQQDNIASSWAASHGYDLFGQKPLTGQQQNLQEINRAGMNARNNIQQALSAYAKISDISKGNPLFGGIAAEIPGTASHTYHDIKTNLGDLGKMLPNVNDPIHAAQTKLQQIDENLRTNYGYGLDSKYLQQFGMTRDSDGNAIPTNQSAKKGDHPILDTAGRIIKGGASDIAGIGKGLASVPVGYVDAALHGESPQQHTGDLAIGAGKGIVNEYGNLLGVKTANAQPILPQDKSVFQKGGFNAPTGADLGTAVNHAIDHPVNTALDVLPVFGAFKGVTATKAAGEAADATGAASKVQDAVIPESKVSNFANQFTVPTKRAMPNDLNVKGTSHEILQHIASGMDGGNLKDIPAQVTGDSGVITKMTRDAVGSIKGEIDMGKPADAASNILDRTRGISDADRKTVLKNIQQAQDISQGNGLAKLNIQDAYDQARQLQSLAHAEMRQSTYLSPNLPAEGVGKAYLSASNEIMDQIEKAAKDNNTLEAAKTPERMAEIQKISPRLAQQVQQAKTIADLRKTASPFVKLDQMNDITDATKNSTFGKVAAQMTGRRSGPAANALGVAGKVTGAVVGNSVLGPYGAMAGSEMLGNLGRNTGMLVDKALQGKYEQAAEKVIPRVQKMVNGGGGPKFRNGAPAVTKSSKVKNAAQFGRFFNQPTPSHQ